MSLEQLATELELSTRSVRRYLKLLEELDFMIDQDGRGRYLLFGDEDAHRFSLEETAQLRDLIMNGVTHEQERQMLLQKLSAHSELLSLAENLREMQQAMQTRDLQDAINLGVKVRLVKYFSANSGTIRDRVVEPLTLDANPMYFKAYDPESDSVKLFRIGRMEKVEVMEEMRSYTQPHEGDPSDIFGMRGPRVPG